MFECDGTLLNHCKAGCTSAFSRAHSSFLQVSSFDEPLMHAARTPLWSTKKITLEPSSTSAQQDRARRTAYISTWPMRCLSPFAYQVSNSIEGTTAPKALTCTLPKEVGQNITPPTPAETSEPGSKQPSVKTTIGLDAWVADTDLGAPQRTLSLSNIRASRC